MQYMQSQCAATAVCQYVLLRYMCTSGFKSANECHQSILLTMRDLSQSTEAQRTPYSLIAVSPRDRSADTEPVKESATE